MGRIDTSEAGGLVGRDHQLEQLSDALTAGHCQAVAVGGVGGIGKSTLVASFCVYARSVGASVVRIDGRDIEPTPQGVLGALASAAGTDDATIDGVVTRLLPFLGRLCILQTTEEFIS